MKIQFNDESLNERIETQYTEAVNKITENWGKGISTVELEVDTDIYNAIVKKVLGIESIMQLRYFNKGYSINKKNNRTSFTIKHLYR